MAGEQEARMPVKPEEREALEQEEALGLLSKLPIVDGREEEVQKMRGPELKRWIKRWTASIQIARVQNYV